MNRVPDSKSVYLMGIGGIGMVNVAAILRGAGYTVLGSDESVYEPAATLLRNLGIEPCSPYAAENLPDSHTPLIVGNVHSRGHVEVEAALSRGDQLYSFPEFLVRHAIAGRHRIVVAGTHGKSTTTSLVAHLLTSIGRDPGYLIGAMPIDLPCGGSFGKPPYFVIEGDEYDSAFFDKRSKFLHYFPRTLVLGPIEFDHADIFANLEEVLTSFRRLVRLLPREGMIIYDADAPHTRELISGAPCRTIAVGCNSGVDWQLNDSADALSFRNMEGETIEWQFRMPGVHNRKNALMAIAAVCALNEDVRELHAGIHSFRGLKRRFERLFAHDGLTVYDDFAHHPTAISATLRALRQSHPQARIIAVLEPRSNTMVRNVFQRELSAALALADHVIFGEIYRAEKIPPNQRLDFDRVAAEVQAKGTTVVHAANSEIPELLLTMREAQPAVIIFMSNGSFSGVPRRFVSLLEHPAAV